MYSPVNPSFTVSKWGLRGVKLHRQVFVMFVSSQCSDYMCLTMMHPSNYTLHIYVFCNSSPYDLNITKTCLYNFDPLKPHIYVVKLGFTGVYIIFLILPKNIDCGNSLEPPRRGGSNEYPQSMFWAEIWKNIRVFYLKIFGFWRRNFLYTWIGVFS